MIRLSQMHREDIGPPSSFASIQRIINQLVPITQFARPGAWNDLDLLEVGNSGLTPLEWAMHFTFWAAAKQVSFCRHTKMRAKLIILFLQIAPDDINRPHDHFLGCIEHPYE